MSKTSIKLGDIAPFLREAFDLARTARKRRIAGQTNAVISDIEAFLDRAEQSEIVQKTAQSLSREAMIRVYTALGRSYREVDRYDDSKKAYQKAVQIDPQNELLWYGIGGLYLRIKEKCKGTIVPANFVTYCEDFCDDQLTALTGAGIVYHHFGNDDQALKCWKDVLNSQAENYSVMFMIAKAHFIRGEDGLARQQLVPLVQGSEKAEHAALYIAVAEKDDPFVRFLQNSRPEEYEALAMLAKNIEPDPQRIWALQQEMRKERALSDGTYNTVWAVANRMGLARLSPISEGAKAGVTKIRKRQPD